MPRCRRSAPLLSPGSIPHARVEPKLCPCSLGYAALGLGKAAGMLQGTRPPYSKSNKQEKWSEKEKSKFSDVKHMVLHVGRYQQLCGCGMRN